MTNMHEDTLTFWSINECFAWETKISILWYFKMKTHPDAHFALSSIIAKQATTSLTTPSKTIDDNEHMSQWFIAHFPQGS